MRRGAVVLWRGKIALYLEGIGQGMARCIDADGNTLEVPRSELSESGCWLTIRWQLLSEPGDRPRRHLCRLYREPRAPIDGAPYTVPDDNRPDAYVAPDRVAPDTREYHAAWLALIASGVAYRVARALAMERKARGVES